MIPRTRRLVLALSLASFALAAQEQEAFEPVMLKDVAGSLDDRPFFASRFHPAIQYGAQPATDRVAELSRQLTEGKVQLKFDKASGYLRSVLESLRTPAESQMLVFSGTSVQAQYIAPFNPRALYFNDDVTVGYIQDAPFLEFAAHDPRQGTVFYTLEQQETAKPRLVRRDNCLTCHESRNSLDVPGMLVRSMGVTSQGDVRPQLGNYITDHRSPFPERWGGWYVTGKTDALRHMGVSADSLQGRFDVNGYAAATSDVAALMVFDHQARMTNLITRMGWEIRAALYQEEKTGKGQEVTAHLLANDARELVDYLLFIDEPQLPGRIQTSSKFGEVFAASGPRDTRGRSLRELDLTRRLMRYPCSYTIYSAAFDGLPAPAKGAIYQRLWDVLSGNEKDRKYSKLAAADRQAILEILRDTKKDLPGFYR